MRPFPGEPQRRRVSFWSFNLTHELMATGLAATALLAGSWFTVDQLAAGYLELHRSDAVRVRELLQEHLTEARLQLAHLSALPTDRQQALAGLLVPAFSDVYRLDGRHQVSAVLKASPGSRVFPGFSFASSHIEPYLKRAASGGVHSSVIERGLEDERASVYFTSTRADTGPSQGRLLGRLNLSYLRNFLRRYSRSAGLPVLLVSHHGFVLLSSDPNLRIAAVDLDLHRSSGGDTLRPIDNRWLPVVANDRGIGAHIVTLIPTDRLDAQRRLVLLPTLAVALLALLAFIWKNRRVHQLLFGPVARFSNQIEVLRSRLARGELISLGSSEAPSRFHEMGQIQSSFEALAQTIRDRDLALQQKLRTSLTAAAIAHEINLPLSTIRIRCQQADLQLRDGALSPQEIQELVRALQGDSQLVNRTIEKMRMLLRNVQTQLVPTEVGVLVNSTISLHKRQLREQGVQLHCRGLPEAGHLTVLADAAQLQMALSNLLRNAIEATAERPRQFREVILSLHRDQDQVVLQVADSGPGFHGDPEADTLMQSSKAGGSGLGLFVVRTTLSNHNGRLFIGRSQELGGAELCIQLPLAVGMLEAGRAH
jgi:signal transduction histidine kinase